VMGVVAVFCACQSSRFGTPPGLWYCIAASAAVVAVHFELPQAAFVPVVVRHSARVGFYSNAVVSADGSQFA
jgi:hypothetical protein